MHSRVKRAAIAGRDYTPATERSIAPPRTVWAVRPWRTSSGQRLLAYKIRADRVDVLVADVRPQWVPAESVLSEHAARRWLLSGFATI